MKAVSLFAFSLHESWCIFISYSLKTFSTPLLCRGHPKISCMLAKHCTMKLYLNKFSNYLLDFFYPLLNKTVLINLHIPLIFLRSFLLLFFVFHHTT